MYYYYATPHTIERYNRHYTCLHKYLILLEKHKKKIKNNNCKAINWIKALPIPL